MMWVTIVGPQRPSLWKEGGNGNGNGFAELNALTMTHSAWRLHRSVYHEYNDAIMKPGGRSTS